MKKKIDYEDFEASADLVTEFVIDGEQRVDGSSNYVPTIASTYMEPQIERVDLYKEIPIINEFTIEEEMGSAGFSIINADRNKLVHVMPNTIITGKNISYEFNHVFMSDILASDRIEKKSNFGNGWRTNLHQKITKKTNSNQNVNGAIDTIYTDGNNVEYTFTEKWYYEVNGTKNYIPKTSVFLDTDNKIKYMDGITKREVKYEVDNAEGYKFISLESLNDYKSVNDLTIINSYKINIINQSFTLSQDKDTGLISIPCFTSSSNINATPHEYENISYINGKYLSHYFNFELGEYDYVQVYPTWINVPLYKNSKFRTCVLCPTYPHNKNSSSTFELNIDVDKSVTYTNIINNLCPNNEQLVNVNSNLKSLEEQMKYGHTEMNNLIFQYKNLKSRLLSETDEKVKETITDSLKNMTRAMGQMTENVSIVESKFYELTNIKNGIVSNIKNSVCNIIIDLQGRYLGFDYFGKFISISNGDEDVINIVYENGKIDKIKSSTNEVKFIYDNSNLLEKIDIQKGFYIEYQYDTNRNLVSTKYINIKNIKRTGNNFSYIDLINIENDENITLDVGNSKIGEFNVVKKTNITKINDAGITVGTSTVIKDYLVTKKNTNTIIIDNLLNTKVRLISNDNKLITCKEYSYFNNRKVEFIEYNEKNKIVKHMKPKINEIILDITNDVQNHLGERFYGVYDIFKFDFDSDLIMQGIAQRYALLINAEDVNLFSGLSVILRTYETSGSVYDSVIKDFSELANGFFIIPIKIDVRDFEAMEVVIDAPSVSLMKLKDILIVPYELDSYEYDIDENLISIYANGQNIKFEGYCGGVPSLVKKTSKSGKEINAVISYNEFGNIILMEDDKGDVFEYTYNEYQQIVESKEYNKREPHNCRIFKTEYNELGQLCLENINIPSYVEESCSISYKYDKNGFVNSEVLPNGSRINYYNDLKTGELLELSATVNGVKNSTQFSYQNGLLTTLSNSAVKFNYEYDAKHRRNRILLSNMEYLNIKYDDSEVNNKKVITTYENGFVLNNNINEKGLIISQQYNEDNINHNYVYTYDEKDRLVKITDGTNIIDYFSYDRYDRIKGVVNQFNSELKVQWVGNYNLDDVLLNETYTFDGSTVKSTYDYMENNIDVVKRVTQGNYVLEIETDTLKRATETSLLYDSKELFREEITYFNNADCATDFIKMYNFKLKGELKLNTEYNYDKSGNISSIESGDDYVRFEYDNLNRIIREDNKKLNKTYVIIYDKTGNIIQRKEYDYSLEKLLHSGKVTNYTYRNGFWKDQLLEFDNEVCTYNAMGYPIVYRDKQLDWSKNGTLKQFENITYSYDHNQIRNEKTVNGISTKYFLQGTKILKEKSSNHSIEFEYLIEKLVGFKYNGVRYIYQRNIKGDITHIYDTDGTLVATYVYDAWGNHNAYDSDGNINNNSIFIGNVNPFRYRGYYFDKETKLYYLNSRYYDPETGRFISPDIISILDETMLQHNGLNLYMYCGNNPVMNIDPSGTAWWKWVIGAVVIAGLGIATIATGGAAAGVAGFIVSGAFKGAVIGAISSALISGTISGISSLNSGNSFISGFYEGAANGFMSGAIIGGITGAVSAPIKVVNAAKMWQGTVEYTPYQDMIRHYNKHVIKEGQQAIAKNIVNYTNQAKGFYINNSTLGVVTRTNVIKIKGAPGGFFNTSTGKILSFWFTRTRG